MELITRLDSPLTSAGTNEVPFEWRGQFTRVSFHMVPIHLGGGSPDAPTFELEWFIGDSYYPVNPPGAAVAMQVNKDNIATIEDVHVKGRLKFVNGATPPDGGVKIEIWGTRL